MLHCGSAPAKISNGVRTRKNELWKNVMPPRLSTPSAKNITPPAMSRMRASMKKLSASKNAQLRFTRSCFRMTDSIMPLTRPTSSCSRPDDFTEKMFMTAS